MSDLNHIYLSTIHAWDDNEVKATDVIKWIMMFLVRMKDLLSCGSCFVISMFILSCVYNDRIVLVIW